MSCCSDCCCPPPLSCLCNPTACPIAQRNAGCAATACCSPCIQPCLYLPPPRPLPATACVTVCSVCRPPTCPQPCKLCPIVRCSKMLFVAPPHRRGYARYCPPTSALPRSCPGTALRLLPPYGTRFMPPMKFSLDSCCPQRRRPIGISPKVCCYSK